MKRTVVVLGALLGMLLTATSPAPAALQEKGVSMAALGGYGPPPPEYVLAADGTLTMGGDIVVNCNEEARFVERYEDDPPSDPYLQSQSEQARGVLEVCERVGFSSSGGGMAAGSIGPSGVEDAKGTPVGGVTEDGFVHTQYGTFVACDSGFPVVEQYAEACGEDGLPQADAQVPKGEDDSAALAQPVGEPPVAPPDYVFEEGGNVTVDGDQGMSCRDFAMFIPQADASLDLEQARSVLEQCEQAGFLPPGGAVLLPETGGPSLVPSLAALLVAFGALVAVLRRRRNFRTS